MLRPNYRIAALVGDLATENDALRLARSGALVKQITTGTLCHLEAAMVEQALVGWDVGQLDLLFIENVGNLVCPAAFDLGEAHKVTVLSTTEGEDKPLKYPDMFAASDLLLLNKSDLLPHLDFDKEACLVNALRVNPKLQIQVVSAKTGEGMQAFYDWIATRAAACVAA